MDEQQAQAANTSYDFTGVKKADSFTVPGTIADFTIADTEHMHSEKKGTPGLKCTFQEAAGSSFSHTFWLTANALSRLQSLAEYVGVPPLTGPKTGAQLEAIFKGKKLPLKIIPQVTNDGKVYADIPFGDFSASNVNELSFTAKELKDIENAEAISSRTSVVNADSETDGMETQGAETPGNKDEAGEF